MKIIGTIRDAILVEATQDELARIAGFRDVSHARSEKMEGAIQSGRNSWDVGLRVGTVIQVSPMWDWMTKARETLKKLTDAGKFLHGLADILEAVPPPALMEPVKPVKIEIVEAERPE